MLLRLITLNGEVHSEDVYEVQIPTRSGAISVYGGHEPLTTIAEPGVLQVRVNKTDRDDEKHSYAVNGGAVQIFPKEIKVLVDEAESAENISADAAEKALARARELRANAKDSVSISEAEALMNRASVRLKVAGLRRRKR